MAGPTAQVSKLLLTLNIILKISVEIFVLLLEWIDNPFACVKHFGVVFGVKVHK